jgi:hypothetical protein
MVDYTGFVTLRSTEYMKNQRLRNPDYHAAWYLRQTFAPFTNFVCKLV